MSEAYLLCGACNYRNGGLCLYCQMCGEKIKRPPHTKEEREEAKDCCDAFSHVVSAALGHKFCGQCGRKYPYSSPAPT